MSSSNIVSNHNHHDVVDDHDEYCEIMMRKRKRKRQAVFRFKSFWETTTELNGSFKENVEALIELGTMGIMTNCVSCNDDHCNINGVSCCSFKLEVQRQPPFHVLFLVLEEEEEASSVMQCTHCLYVGWGHENISSKRYHFVLPSKNACFNCRSKEVAAAHEEKKSTNNCYSKFSNLIDFDAHILHGVFHSNGVGHLLAVNAAFESGSLLTGHQIMDFWDRLCTALQARKVSLNDASKKQGMELRLLHGVAYGQPWFGRWGYQFGRGCYGVTQEIYQKALQALQTIPLYLFTNHIEIPNDVAINVPLIFSKYQTLSHSSLITLSDIFHFMLVLKSRVPREAATPNFDSFSPTPILGDNNMSACRWSSKRVEAATRVIVETLKMAEFRWVSRQEVRDVARSYIGDTGLLDFVLKSLGNHIVGNYLVRRCLNPVTKVLEYRLENVDLTGLILDDRVTVMNKSRVKSKYNITRAQVMNDLLYLYKQILVRDSILLPDTCFYSTIILDSRYLVKVYAKEVSMVKVPKLNVDNGSTSSRSGGEVDEKQMVVGCGRVVDCVCGCREDDGERLISCDICEVWQHTRCVHISNDQQIPHIFLCNKCEQKILFLHSLP